MIPSLAPFWPLVATATAVTVGMSIGWRRYGRPGDRATTILLVGIAFAVAATPLFVVMAGVRLPATLIAVMPALLALAGMTAMALLARGRGDDLETVNRDVLSGCLNRRGLQQAAEAAISDARRRDRPLAMVMADIDFMKTINDRRGHECGDHVLTAFAACVRGCIRERDLLARLGGDEFCLTLIDADEDEAIKVIERARREVEALEPAPGLSITATFGVARLEAGEDNFHPVLARADEALRAAKRQGRNRVGLYRPSAIAA